MVNVTDAQAPYEQYLSRHLAHAGNPERYRHRKKAYIAHNYGRFLPRDFASAILDIGPGFGELLELLAVDRGYRRVNAIDVSAEVVTYCNGVVPDSTLLVDDTRSYLEAHRDRFELVFLLHVLEHVPKHEVVPLLRAIRGALTHDGSVVIEVPNMANPLFGSPVRYADITHELGFTELSLAHVLRGAGYSHVSLYPYRLPPDRAARVAQWAGQKVCELGLRTAYRLYGARAAGILTPSLVSKAQP